MPDLIPLLFGIFLVTYPFWVRNRDPRPKIKRVFFIIGLMTLLWTGVDAWLDSAFDKPEVESVVWHSVQDFKWGLGSVIKGMILALLIQGELLPFGKPRQTGEIN